MALTGFGVARMRESLSTGKAMGGTPLTAEGAVLGTPPYLAPEQVLARPVTALTDVYALGIVGDECLAGRRPFDRENPWATAMARVTDPLPPLDPDIPAVGG